MQRIRIVVLTMVAVFATSAVAASSAAAVLPEFSPSSGVTLNGTSGAGLLETKSGTKVTCTSNTDSGEITGPKAVSKIKVTFKGCESGGFKCSTAGAASGELVTEELKATLGYINATTKEVGVDFTPVGAKFIEFNCVGGIIEVTVTGSVICPVTPINTKTKTFTVACRQEKGIQKPTKLVGELEDVLFTKIGALGLEEQSGEETTATVTATPEGEIKA
jgi:hypothetical protein